jgi:hypothetical protein
MNETVDYFVGCLHGILNLRDFWSNDLPSHIEVFLNEHLLWVLWRQIFQLCAQHLVVNLLYTDGFELPVTDS